MKNYVLLTALLLLFSISSFAEVMDTSVCAGAQFKISRRDGSPISVYIKDTASTPIFTGIVVDLTFNLEDSLYILHVDQKDTSREDIWWFFHVIPPPDGSFHCEVTGLEVICYSANSDIKHHSWLFPKHSWDDTLKYTFKEYGKYVIEHIGYNSIGCGGYAADTIMIVPDNAKHKYGCEGQQIALQNGFNSDSGTMMVYIKDSLQPIVIPTAYTFPSKANAVYYLRHIPHDTTKEEAWIVLHIMPRPNAAFSHTVDGFEATFNPVTDVKLPPIWILGDNTSSGAVGSFKHKYAAPGEYIVEHVVKDTIGCIGHFKDTVIVPSWIHSNTLSICDKMQVTMGANGIITAYRNGDIAIIAQGKNLNFPAKLNDKSYFFHVVPDDTTIAEKWYMMRVYPLPDASFTYTVNGLSVTFKPRHKFIISPSWYMGDDYYFPSTDTFTYNYDTPGSYVVMHTVTDTTGCIGKFRDTVHVGITGIDFSKKNPFDITLYPNPATTYTELSFNLTNEASVTVDLLDINGRKLSNLNAVARFSSGQHTIDLDTQDLDSGLYFIRFKVKERMIYKKLMKI